MSCTLNLAFFPPYSFVPFYVSERRSWADNFRDTRSHCWVAWGQLWPFWKFEKERKKKYKTFMRLWNLSLFLREEGHTSWGVKSTVFPFCLVKIIRQRVIRQFANCLCISVWHRWAGSQDFGNKVQVDLEGAVVEIWEPVQCSYMCSCPAAELLSSETSYWTQRASNGGGFVTRRDVRPKEPVLEPEKIESTSLFYRQLCFQLLAGWITFPINIRTVRFHILSLTWVKSFLTGLKLWIKLSCPRPFQGDNASGKARLPFPRTELLLLLFIR